jgi:hypothetical protein
MNHILFKSFVKPFYRENAGIIIFVYSMLVCVVSSQSGAGLYEYHLVLAEGLLKNTSILLVVFFCWFLYSRKFAVFVSAELHKPEYAFIRIFNNVPFVKRLWLFFIVEVWLLIPVLFYCVFIIYVGLLEHYYLSVSIILAYLVSLCAGAAVWHVHQLNHPAVNGARPLPVPILVRFVAREQKLSWLGLKLFTCGILYVIAKNNSLQDFDVHTAFLIFSVGILFNGVIVYRIKEFEAVYLSFYRGMPVSLWKRLATYALLYFILLIPEFITLHVLTPYMGYSNVISFCLCGYGSLLLINSLGKFSKRGYIQVLSLLFCIQYTFLITVGLVPLYLLYFALTGIIFSRYYKA